MIDDCGRLRRVALASLLVLACVGPAGAEAEGPDHWMVVGVRDGSGLVVRAAPGVQSRRVGLLPHDARRIENLGCVGETPFAEWQEMTPAQRGEAAAARWCRVRLGDLEGWSAGRYLAEDAGPAG